MGWLSHKMQTMITIMMSQWMPRAPAPPFEILDLSLIYMASNVSSNKDYARGHLIFLLKDAAVPDDYQPWHLASPCMGF